MLDQVRVFYVQVVSTGDLGSDIRIGVNLLIRSIRIRIGIVRFRGGTDQGSQDMIGKAAESAVVKIASVPVIGNLIAFTAGLGVREIMGGEVQQEKLGKVDTASCVVLFCQIGFQSADGGKCPAGIIWSLIPGFRQFLCYIGLIADARQLQLAAFRDRVDRIAVQAFTRLRFSSDFLKGDLGNLIFVFRSGRGFLFPDVRGSGYGSRGFVLLVWGGI